MIKKFFLCTLSFVALSLLLASCGGGADANYDQQNIQKTATTLRSFVKEGASFDKVDKALKKAGFVQRTPNNGTPVAAPAVRAPQKTTTTTAKYSYNAPEDFIAIHEYHGYSDSERIVGFNRIVASNRIYAEVYISFDFEGRLEDFDIEFVMNKELAPDHSFFVTLENALYNELDFVPKSFEGELCNSEREYDKKQNIQTFSDREKYFTALTNRQSVYATGSYKIILRGIGFYVPFCWTNHSLDAFAEEEVSKLGYKPFTQGYISFSHSQYEIMHD